AAEGFTGVTMFALTHAEAQALVQWPQVLLRRIAGLFTVVSLNVAAEVTGEIARVVDSLAGCHVLFSHLGLPGRFGEVPTREQAAERIGDLLDLSALEHVGVKISGYTAVSDPPYAYPHEAAFPFGDVLLERFGPWRLHWGSDFPSGMRW